MYVNFNKHKKRNISWKIYLYAKLYLAKYIYNYTCYTHRGYLKPNKELICNATVWKYLYEKLLN